MVDSPNFEPYLRSLTHHCAQWWKPYAFIDEIDDLTWFEFELTSKTQEKSTEPGRKPEEKTQLVLKAIADYSHEKILIVGSPGAGKSTLLTRILWQAAERAKQDETETAPIPVLVELKLYPELDIWERIQMTLENCDLYLEIPEIKQLVKDKRLLLLADGFNELPTDGARAEFKKFCGRNILVIVTSRDAADGLGLERKLELQPPSDQQVARFLEERLPDSDRAQLQKLGDRVKDLGQTPLMIWMLYSIFRAKHDETPETRGEVYRAFTMLYAERAKEGIDLTESRLILSKLAFEMMQSLKPDDPTDFRLDISEVDAQTLLGSEKVLKHLVNNHLLQWQGKPGNRKVRFCHQSLQEYYAAEFLLLEKLLKELKEPSERNNKILQQEYSNYLKWTEPIALMLGLVEDEGQALRVVELAIGVDLMLGARLAGQVTQEFQGRSVKLVEGLEDIHDQLKIELMGETRSKEAIKFLAIMLQSNNPSVRMSAAEALGKLGSKVGISLLKQTLKDEDFWTRMIVSGILWDIDKERTISSLLQTEELQCVDFYVHRSAPEELKKLGYEETISSLLQALQNEDSYIRAISAYALVEIGSKASIPALLQALQDEAFLVRRSAVYALGELGSEVAIPALLQALQDEAFLVRKSVTEILGKFDIPETLMALWQRYRVTAQWEMRSAIATIQSRCQFYNYEIFQAALALEAMPRPSTTPSIQYDIKAEIVQIIEHNDGKIIGK